MQASFHAKASFHGIQCCSKAGQPSAKTADTRHADPRQHERARKNITIFQEKANKWLLFSESSDRIANFA
jgi:hypothetical protein